VRRGGVLKEQLALTVGERAGHAHTHVHELVSSTQPAHMWHALATQPHAMAALRARLHLQVHFALEQRRHSGSATKG
jgi:hypothetical protein